MSMQTDVKASIPLTATGQVQGVGAADLGRVRVKGLYAVGTAVAGSVALRNSVGAGGTVFWTMDTPAVIGATYIPLPDEGILFEAGVHATIANVTTFTLFYG